MNNLMMHNNLFKVGAYLRLSKEDDNKLYRRENESESITNQRSLIMNYIKDNGFILTKEYVDDGFSGTTFDDRPAFRQMIKDIEQGKINTVITKDLSRLGRDYIQSGYYLEQYFPSKKVRYISILDNIDTFLDSANNDIAPFKALFNDMTSKDTSKKIRSILKDKKRQGLFLGSEAAYGYMKDPNNKHYLIPNPDTAPIVRKIFDYALAGLSIANIATILNNDKVKTPHAYKNRKPTNKRINIYYWTNSSVNKILKNRVYTGDLVQNVQSKLNYKSKKKIKLAEKDWIIVENTHEAIITKEEFEVIQNSSKKKRKTITKRNKLLFENLVFCSECGGALSANYNKRQNSWSLNCNKYTRSPRLRLCDPHFIPYKKFEEVVLDRIRKIYFEQLRIINIEELVNKIFKTNSKKVKAYNEKEMIKNKIDELTKKLDTLYDDRFKKNISLETYIRLSKNIENEIKSLNQRIKEFVLPEQKSMDKYKILAQEIIDFKNNPRPLLFQLIKKIEVDKNKVIRINYNFKI